MLLHTTSTAQASGWDSPNPLPHL